MKGIHVSSHSSRIYEVIKILQFSLQQIKNSIPIRQCMERYGIEFDSRGKCRCVFHNDKNPSMSLKGDKFKCFSCGATGDIFDFVMMRFNLGLYEAVKQLDNDFGLGIVGKELTPHQRRIVREEMRKHKVAQAIEHNRAEKHRKKYICLCEELHVLERYLEAHKPIDIEADTWVKNYNRHQYLQYALDDLLKGKEYEGIEDI